MSWFGASKNKPSLTHAQALAAKPVRLVQETIEPTADGGGKLLVRYQPRFRWIFKVPEGATKTFEFDAIGRMVWEACDGRTSVQQIIRRLATRYDLSTREAEVSTRAFLRTLTRKRLIGIAIDTERKKS